jgi:hypothetical protein
MLAMYPVIHVPMFEPSIIRMAEATDNSPLATKLIAMPIVAELEWMMAVRKMPIRSARVK